MKSHEIRQSLRRVSGPAVEALGLEEVKEWLRVDGSADDLRLTGLIMAARELLETQRHCSLLQTTWALRMDRFPSGAIELRRVPVLAVSSVAYLDEGGESQVLAADRYRLDSTGIPGRLTPAYGQSWPSTWEVTNAVTVTFTAGYGTSPVDVPISAKHAMQLLIAEWFETGANIVQGAIGTIPNGADVLMQTVGWGGYR